MGKKWLLINMRVHLVDWHVCDCNGELVIQGLNYLRLHGTQEKGWLQSLLGKNEFLDDPTA